MKKQDLRLGFALFNIIAGTAALFHVILTTSCGPQHNGEGAAPSAFSVTDFHPVTNLMIRDDLSQCFIISLDYSDAMDGFIIPDSGQIQGDALQYSFRIRNDGKEPVAYHYKIYYQNESYKFPEYSLSGKDTVQHVFASENFYGSWEDHSEGFRLTEMIPPDDQFHLVTGKLRIVGNPRDEQRYFSDGRNDRWKRNPRTGKYSFLLVIYPASTEIAIPEHMEDLSIMKEGQFVNPYFYYWYARHGDREPFHTVPGLDSLKVIACPPLSTGVYADPNDFQGDSIYQYCHAFCGKEPALQKAAAFKQFVHYVDSASTFDNIPVIADVTGGHYSLTDYNWNRAFTAADEKVRIKPMTVECPCRELETDSVKGSIRMINRAASRGRWEKQDIGIITRHGFTYGTYTVKIRLQELLNREGIWNGLTNAVWLITQADEAWNNRRACEESGYILDYYGDGKSKRGEYSAYSEIDFEILKTSAYCPEYIYPPAYPHPVADPGNRSLWDLPYPVRSTGGRKEVMVCCTNWDMACPQPENYDVGCQDLSHAGTNYTSHRWDHWYKAITCKRPAIDDELFASGYYYFQIIWKPEEIIWRIGPAKNNLKTVGYMNASMTSIPNNQMLLIISQEFHSTKWWPGSPFPQEFIPFPGSDLTGEVFEVTIE